MYITKPGKQSSAEKSPTILQPITSMVPSRPSLASCPRAALSKRSACGKETEYLRVLGCFLNPVQEALSLKSKLSATETSLNRLAFARSKTRLLQSHLGFSNLQPHKSLPDSCRAAAGSPSSGQLSQRPYQHVPYQGLGRGGQLLRLPPTLCTLAASLAPSC